MKPEQHRIAVFFSGNIHSYYQIEQWRKPFQALSEEHPLLYLVTDYEVYLQFARHEALDVLYLQTFSDLIAFYDETDLSVILYINNALRNFQSLRHGKSYHVHLNHGESEKECMRSNQSQGYDLVCTVGQRGIDRYREHLLNFQPDKYRAIGRPQLDFIKALPSPAGPGQKVILYAPTWEATHPSMNYTSVPVCGINLVQQILGQENYVLIYKPHAALGTREESAAEADRAIRQMIAASDNGYCRDDYPINNVFTVVDFAFFDNSSVMIDYLHAGKPAVYLEVLEDQSVHGLAEAFITLKPDEAENILPLLMRELEQDSRAARRQQIREYYLGDYAAGESTQRLISLMEELIERRRQKFQQEEPLQWQMP